MTLKFDASGRYIPAKERLKMEKAKTEAISELEAKLNASIAREIQARAQNALFGEFEVVIGLFPDLPFEALGHTKGLTATISASEIAKYIWKWLKAEHGCLPLLDALIDALSEVSVHELIHRDGPIWHEKLSLDNPYCGWTQRDFDYIVAKLGHQFALKVSEIRKDRFARVYRMKTRGPTKRVIRGLVVIDLPGAEA